MMRPFEVGSLVVLGNRSKSLQRQANSVRNIFQAKPWSKLLAMFSAILVAACGTVDFTAAPEGKFTGSLFVMWVDEGGAMGDGTFVYVPNPNAPLTFVRESARSFPVIQPEMMYTDGGSIPKAAQLFRGFSPWGYAPAYMVHDWLFVARHCNLDGEPTGAERKMDGMDFQTSAEITAEAIKTLIATDRIKENDVAPPVISSAVAGPIARSIWNRRGVCLASRVSEADRLAAEAGIPGSSTAALASDRILKDGTGAEIKPARIVAQVRF